MPIYEYVCRSCGHEIEKLQGMSDAPLTDCQTCGEAALQRKVSAPNFRLAGGGWYETDFKSEGRRNLADDGGGSNDTSQASGSGSGDSGGSGASEKSDKSSSTSESKSESSSGTSGSGSGESGGSSTS